MRRAWEWLTCEESGLALGMAVATVIGGAAFVMFIRGVCK